MLYSALAPVPRVQQDEVLKREASESSRVVSRGGKLMTAAHLQLSCDVNFDAAKLSSFATDCDVARPGHLVGWNPVYDFMAWLSMSVDPSCHAG